MLKNAGLLIKYNPHTDLYDLYVEVEEEGQTKPMLLERDFESEGVAIIYIQDLKGEPLPIHLTRGSRTVTVRL